MPTVTGDTVAWAVLAISFFGLLGLAGDLRGLPAVARLALQAAGAAVVGALLVLPLPLARTTWRRWQRWPPAGWSASSTHSISWMR